MKASKGGFTWGDILALDEDDFGEALDAAEDLEQRIAEAMKRG